MNSPSSPRRARWHLPALAMSLISALVGSLLVVGPAQAETVNDFTFSNGAGLPVTTAEVGKPLTADFPDQQGEFFVYKKFWEILNSDGTTKQIPSASRQLLHVPAEARGNQLRYTAILRHERGSQVSPDMTKRGVIDVTLPSLLTPRVDVSGERTHGSVVTATVGDWGTPVSPSELSYQWFTGVPGAEIVLPEATGQSLELPLDAVGQNVFVRITATVPDFEPHTVTSGRFTVESRAFPAPTITLLPEAPVVGDTLTLSVAGWGEMTPTEVRKEWFVGDDPVLGTTTDSLLLTDAMADKAVWVRVTATNKAAGYGPTSWESSRIPVTARPVMVGNASVSLGLPVVGTDWVGTLENADDLEPGSSVSWTWEEFRAGRWATLMPYPGPEVPVRSLTDSSRGYTYRLNAYISKPGTEPVRLTSAERLVPLAQFADAQLTLSAEGDQLRVTHERWGTDSGKRTITWLVGDQVIPDQSGDTLTVTPAMRGRDITVQVRATASGYAPKIITSDPFTLPMWQLGAGDFSLTRSGDTLSLTGEGWNNPDVQEIIVWHRDEDVIPGATGRSYALTALDFGTSIEAIITPRTVGYIASDEARSIDVPLREFDTLGQKSVTLSPDQSVGAELTATLEGWNARGRTVTWTWYTVLGSTSTLIPGTAGVETLTLTPDLLGKQVTAVGQVSAPGYRTVPLESSVVTVVEGTFSGTPAVTLTPATAVGQTIEASFSGVLPEPDSVAWQWHTVAPNGDRTLLAGETETSIELTPELVGENLVVTAIPSLLAYASPAPTSSSERKVLHGEFDASTPSITVDGEPLGQRVSVGQTLTVESGAWTPSNAQLTYEWFGDQDSLGTGETLLLTAEHVGQRLRAVVTGSATGYGPDPHVLTAQVSAEVVPAPSVSLGSATPQTGESLTVTGSHFDPNTPVTLSLHEPVTAAAFMRIAQAPLGKQIGDSVTATPNQDGTFTARLLIPAGTPAGTAVVSLMPLGLQQQVTLTAPPAQGPSEPNGNGGSDNNGSPSPGADLPADDEPSADETGAGESDSGTSEASVTGAGSNTQVMSSSALASTGAPQNVLFGLGAAFLLGGGLMLTLARRRSTSG